MLIFVGFLKNFGSVRHDEKIFSHKTYMFLLVSRLTLAFIAPSFSQQISQNDAMEKLLEPFGFTFGQLQDIATLLNHLEINNVSIEVFIEYVEDQKKERVKSIKEQRINLKTAKEKWQRIALKCPECNTAMSLYPVNSQTGDQAGDGLNSQWQCPKCWYDEYSTKTIREQFDELRK